MSWIRWQMCAFDTYLFLSLFLFTVLWEIGIPNWAPKGVPNSYNDPWQTDLCKMCSTPVIDELLNIPVTKSQCSLFPCLTKVSTRYSQLKFTLLVSTPVLVETFFPEEYVIDHHLFLCLLWTVKWEFVMKAHYNNHIHRWRQQNIPDQQLLNKYHYLHG